MVNEKWRKIKKIFSSALEKEEQERENYIKKACGDDHELLQEVQSLLASHENPGPLDKSPEELKSSLITRLETQSVKGKQISRYKLIKELGHGGMGNVYLAERADGQYQQYVALKLLRTGFKTENQINRFVAERQILASLVHKNIARLIDGEVTEFGQPWFAMEYIVGLPIDRYCDENQLSIKERLSLFTNVCNAVHFAHQKLIVHRDVKPSNIFVEKDGTVKLLDFGIAKALKPDDFLPGQMPVTKTGLLPLTPAYASPEQIRGEPVTTASDIHQLGVLLYELLTGNLPYDVSGKTPSEIERIICEQKPTRPSTAVTQTPSQKQGSNSTQKATGTGRRANLQKILHGELDTIVLKAMHKEPERRYESADHLASDIQNYLTDKPVSAHPDSRLYRARKYISRHRIGVSAITAVFFSLFIGIGAALWQTKQANQALTETRQALGRANALQGFLLDLFRSADPDRPRDQLPDTEEILALGAKRAMDPGSAPPEERFEMLMAIAGVYSYHAQAAQSGVLSLMDEAVTLARQSNTLGSNDLSRALERRAQYLVFNEGNLDEAEEQLIEAESLIVEYPEHWETFARVRITRSWKESFRGDPERALDLLEPLYEKMNQNSNDSQEIRARILDRLAGLYRGVGDLETSSVFRTRAIKSFEQHYGPESRQYAVALANSVSLEHDLGRFDRAESRAQQAIELYNQIFREPRDYRASVRLSLAETLFSSGHFDEAFEELERSSMEWASFMGQDMNEWRSHFISRGNFYMRINKVDKAIQDFTRLWELVDQYGGQNDYIVSAADMWLAWALCRRGEVRKGNNLLEEIKKRGGETFFGYPENKAELYEARATCSFQSGELKKSLEEIEIALSVFENRGRVVTIADRRILHARILAADNQHEKAAKSLDRAEKNFFELNLTNHPYLTRIKDIRSEWVQKN